MFSYSNIIRRLQQYILELLQPLRPRDVDPAEFMVMKMKQ